MEWQMENGMEEGTQWGWCGRGNTLGSSFGAELKVVGIKNEEMGEIAKRSWKSMFFNFAWPCGIFA